jgi:polysaccharide biosynthesis/export protein
VDLDKLIKEGSTSLNIEINGGDVVFVPEAGVFFVDGAVRKPGSYPIKQKTNVSEALIAAGGFAPYAKKDRITLVRYVDGGDREIIELDLEGLDGRDEEVRDRDVIIAKESTLGKMLHGTGINLGIPGLLGLGYRDPAR